MRKQALTVEWQIAENDADWERRCVLPMPSLAPDATRRTHLKRCLWSVSVLLLLLVSAGGWWWRTDQAALPQPTAKVTATAHPALGDAVVISLPGDQAAWAGDHTTTDGRRQEGQEDSSVPTAIQTFVSAARLDIALPAFEVQGDLAVARVVMYTEHGGPAYRQTRFYRLIGPDWRQTAPDAALWGPERSLETAYFVYHFRQNDAQAVIAVSPLVDALYMTIRQNFGLPVSLVGLPTLLFAGEKLLIEVSVTQPPGQASNQGDAPDRIIVPSPALYRAPAELTDAELLAQSIALPLLEQVVTQASEQYALGATWQPVLSGLYLWQVWEMGLPLSAWREEVVQWLYTDLSVVASGQPPMLPDRYPDLCAAHKLWMVAPTQLNIPLLCADLDLEYSYFSSWVYLHPTRPAAH